MKLPVSICELNFYQKHKESEENNSLRFGNNFIHDQIVFDYMLFLFLPYSGYLHHLVMVTRPKSPLSVVLIAAYTSPGNECMDIQVSYCVVSGNELILSCFDLLE